MNDLTDAGMLHQDTIVIDSTCPLWHGLVAEPPKYLDLCKAGGYTAVAPTIGGLEGAAVTARALGVWLRVVRESDDLVLVRTAQDILDAKATGRIGIIFHFQGTEPLEDSLDLVDAYKAMGVGIIQLAYNTRNRFCDGSEEDGNAGLSKLGRRLIGRMNAARVIVDCSHTGERTSLEAIDACSSVTVFSHANVKAVHDCPRNITDTQVKAIAANRGVIGVLAYPPFVSAKERPDIDDYIDHIDHIANLVGVDHVGIAPDYFHWQHPFVSTEQAAAQRERRVKQGKWDPQYYKAPPYYYPSGMETPDKMGNVTARLLERGYAPDDVRKIMGLNWIRVYREVWDS